MFKNETHNHPTEIEPFGGAATCLGGAIRDPLSGRSYVYQAMRVTGAGDPTVPLSEDPRTASCPQRKLYHDRCCGLLLLRQPDRPCYRPRGTRFITRATLQSAWRSALCVGAAPLENVIREVPEPGDIVILLGRQDRARRLRRCNRLLQGAHRGIAGNLRRGGTEGQPARGAQAPASVPRRAMSPG